MSNAGKKFSKFLIGVGLALSSMANVHAKGDSGEIENLPIAGAFTLNDNDIPSFWGRPISVVYYDETGLHSSVLENAVAFAELYAEVSRTQAVYHERQLDPTIGLVIADDRFDPESQGTHLSINPRLAEELLKIWGGTPLELAILNSETRSAFSGIRDGDDCSLFADGIQVNRELSYFVFSSAVIVANSNMNANEISLCFHNKIALAFGLSTNNFDAEKVVYLDLPDNDFDWLQTAYFGTYPGTLQSWGLCWKFSPNPSLDCVQEIFLRSTEVLDDIARNPDGRLTKFLESASEDEPSAWNNQVNVKFHEVEDWQVSALQGGESLVHLYSSALGTINPFDPVPTDKEEQDLILAIQEYEIVDNEVFFENPSAIQSELENRSITENGGLKLEIDDLRSEICLFVTNATSEEHTHYSISMIIAHSSLTRDELELCFLNRISAYFGFQTGEPEQDFELSPSIISSANFYLTPILLRGVATCRDLGEINTKCVSEDVQMTTKLILQSF